MTIALCAGVILFSWLVAWFLASDVFAPQMRKLHSLEQKEKALLASIGDGVIAADENGCAILVNAAAERMMGWKAEELLGRPLFEIIYITDDRGRPVPIEKRPIQKAILSKKPFTTSTSSPYYYRRKDGTDFPAAITATPVLQNGKLIGAIDIFRDITREKEIDVAKSTFVSLASHQLRTPLTTIRWSLETLQSEVSDRIAPHEREFLNDALQSTEQLVALVRELLNISRIDTGRISVNPKSTNLGALVLDVVKSLEHDRQTKSITVKKQIEKKLPKVSIDALLIRQVILNFLTNALKYTPAGGTVTIELKKDGRDIRFAVTDSGIGIPPQEQSQIFSRFFRASNARSHHEGGSGLGLYLARMLVELSGGKIGFSTVEQKGSTFWCTLPLRGSKPRAGEVSIDVKS